VSAYIFYVFSPEYSFKEGFQINKRLFSILVILYPLVDLLRVFVFRNKKGKSPFTVDNRHIHHVILKDKSHLLKTLSILLLFSI
jgi:UDP-N-acetylmuramyl pentapeptide phosphotransferase/UDP-N-acetylglucosamine-1-phosphate transferase